MKHHAGEAMYKKAKERKLIETLLELCAEVRRENGKIDTTIWTTNGMIKDLGEVMKEKGEPQYPGNKS